VFCGSTSPPRGQHATHRGWDDDTALIPSEVGVPIRPAIALPWIGDALEGSSLQLATSPRLNNPGRAIVLIRDPLITDLEDFAQGRRLDSGEIDELARRLLALLQAEGAQTIVVEHDLQRRGDRHASGQVAFIGDRVLRWAPLTDDSQAAITLLRRGSSGHPLCALVSELDEDGLGLGAGVDLSPLGVDRLARSAVALFVSAYDAESYLVWLMPRPLDRD
jgi:hypothetical protein